MMVCERRRRRRRYLRDFFSFLKLFFSPKTKSSLKDRIKKKKRKRKEKSKEESFLLLLLFHCHFVVWLEYTTIDSILGMVRGKKEFVGEYSLWVGII